MCRIGSWLSPAYISSDSLFFLQSFFLHVHVSFQSTSSDKIQAVIQSDCISLHRVSSTKIRINSRIHSDQWSAVFALKEDLSISSPVRRRSKGRHTRPTVLCTCWRWSDITFRRTLWLRSSIVQKIKAVGLQLIIKKNFFPVSVSVLRWRFLRVCSI